MADRAQFRKCEELLLTLADQSQRLAPRARNPVWVLLKGIEGFDTARASECLVKLLDKHYDTIGVLKLATKRDLVEDAGILPGDALRIIAAAGHYVEPPQDTDRSDGQVPQEDTSAPVLGEPHQAQDVKQAYRPPALREKALLFAPPATSHANTHEDFGPLMQKKARIAAQESWRSVDQVTENRTALLGIDFKKVEGAASTLDAVKISKGAKEAALSKVPAQTHPVPVGTTSYPHTCGICNVKCVSEIYCRMHSNGRVHKANVAQPLDTANAGLAQEVLVEAKQPTHCTAVVPAHACGVCNVKCTSVDNLRFHFTGRKHALKMKQAANGNDNRPTPFLHCSICNIDSTCKKNLVMHFNGKKHAQNMKVQSDSGDSAYYSNSESDS